YHRVRSYFTQAEGQAPRTRVFVNKVRDLKVLTTQTEQEALILESNFVKKHQPRYNVLLKDDKHYPYIRLTTQEVYPRLEVVRKMRKDGATYFGPYTMVKEVRETIRLIYKIFPLRQSSDALDGTPKRRPCLNYQMKRCLAPCAGLVPPQDYARVVQDVILFLKGKSTELTASLKEKMKTASAEQRYEEAAVYRDKISAVKTVLDKQKIVSTSLVNQDVIACCQEPGLAMVQVLIIRSGKMIAEKIFKMKNLNDEDERATLSAFLKQYYADEPILPEEILLQYPVEDVDLIQDWLSEKRKSRVRIEVPSKGRKRELVAMADQNARFALRNEVDQGDVATRSLEELQESLGLKNFPAVIEGFDISNTFGTNAVGSMVVFQNGRVETKLHRRYKIRQVAGIDDYAMLTEVMLRRYARLLDEGKPLPDLILIDGGKGHLNAALSVFADLGIDDIAVAAIAKGADRNAGKERFYMAGRQAFRLPPRDPVLYFLERLRDEAHRFAIGGHRAKRAKATGTSVLDEIRGIGAKRKRALLHHFGSARGVAEAGLADLEIVAGINKTVAKKIYDHFHSEA
ncbi:MAG: excinuclease ABC subunit UvrC, partial [Proteobacteria bacterium]|nr:excinuclease ABC subunit UvrC [Pseudomonadota bacterium]